MELLVYPAVYLLWKWHTDVKNAGRLAVPLPGEQILPGPLMQSHQPGP